MTYKLYNPSFWLPCPLQNLWKEVSRRHPDQRLEPALTPLDAKQQLLRSELSSDSWAQAMPGRPTHETHCVRLYPQSHSFGHYPKLMNIVRVATEVDWWIKSFAFWLNASSPEQSGTTCASQLTSDCPSFSTFILPSLLNKAPRYLTPLARGSDSLRSTARCRVRNPFIRVIHV